MSDNPEQVQSLKDLRQTAEARLQEIIDVGPENLDAAVAAVRGAAPQRLTDIVRENLDGFRRVEVDLRRQREKKAAADMTRTVTFAVGSTILALVSGSIGLLALQRERDRNRERELQLELAHMGRLTMLAMLGEKAAVLAHELNQPLTAITSYMDTAALILDRSGEVPISQVRGALERAGQQATRAGAILGRLRGFVEKAEPTKTLEDVSNLFEEAIALLGGFMVTTHAAPGLGSVIVDKVEIQQVLIILLRNAVEAMEAGSRRELQLSAVPIDNCHVQISVSDTGPGLAKEVAEKLFQPFVSTKTNGMGVGLSICRTIIDRNGGRVWVTPNPDGGTIFSFTLPQATTG